MSALRIAALFAGDVGDAGFMQSGYEALCRARDELGCRLDVAEGIPFDRIAMVTTLRALAASGPDLVVAHGGQNDAPVALVSQEFPGVRFTVTQGAVLGPNLNSYQVLQEQSAFLAGVLAALSTGTGVVGHLCGIRVPPALLGRAAYAAGVAAAGPPVRLLTTFCGDQDDPERAERVARAQIEAGADVIFTMLNAGRPGATRACAAGRAREIGNVVDRVTVPAEAAGVVLGSAVADVGAGLLRAIRDLAAGRWRPATLTGIGLEDPAVVRLALASDVPDAVRERVDAWRTRLLDDRHPVPTSWSGPEFEV